MIKKENKIISKYDGEIVTKEDRKRDYYHPRYFACFYSIEDFERDKGKGLPCKEEENIKPVVSVITSKPISFVKVKVFKIGKYKGMTYEKVMKENPSYIRWLEGIENYKNKFFK